MYWFEDYHVDSEIQHEEFIQKEIEQLFEESK